MIKVKQLLFLEDIIHNKWSMLRWQIVLLFVLSKCFALSLYQMKPGLSEGNLLKIVNSTQF